MIGTVISFAFFIFVVCGYISLFRTWSDGQGDEED